MRKRTLRIVGVMVAALSAACGDAPTASSGREITAFAVTDIPGTIAATDIQVVLPFGTDRTALIATFATTGQTVTVGGVPQVSGVTVNDFTKPLVYTVVAADGATRDYTVTVTDALNPAKDITSYSIMGIAGEVGVIHIGVTVPAGTDVTALVATFTTSGTTVRVGGVAQTSGVTPNNFTSPVTYTVTAADGSTKDYLITVTVAGS